MAFTKLGLSSPMLEGVRAMGYVEPTPIQLRAIPLILAGQDVIGSAQTGTGKTAAFALPILSQLGQHSPQPRLLVLEPTRELAAQVETAIRDFARFTNLRTAVVFGGVGYGRQMDALARRRGCAGGHARAGCSTICSAAPASSTASSSSCWTRPTACSTWDSCPTCGAFSTAAPATGTPRCSPPPSRPRSRR